MTAEGAFILGGIALLWAGAELAVRGAVGVAGKLRISPVLTGLIFVSGVTAVPEFAIAEQALSIGRSDMAIGHLIGSNIANALLILGLVAVIRPLPSSPVIVLRDGVAMVGACLAFAVLAQTGSLNVLSAIVLLAALGGYLALTFLMERGKPSRLCTCVLRVTDAAELKQGLAVYATVLVVGGILLYFGARFLVAGAAAYAHVAGLPDAYLGLSLTALGAALPELSATLVAALRRHTGVAAGSLAGSIVVNTLGVVGILALIHPMPVGADLARVDVWVMVAAVALLVPMLATGWRLSRVEGLALFALYAGYFAYIADRAGALS